MAMLLPLTRSQPRPLNSLRFQSRQITTDSSSSSSQQRKTNGNATEKNSDNKSNKSAASSLRSLPSKAKESIKTIVKVDTLTDLWRKIDDPAIRAQLSSLAKIAPKISLPAGTKDAVSKLWHSHTLYGQQLWEATKKVKFPEALGKLKIEVSPLDLAKVQSLLQGGKISEAQRVLDGLLAVAREKLPKLELPKAPYHIIKEKHTTIVQYLSELEGKLHYTFDYLGPYINPDFSTSKNKFFSDGWGDKQIFEYLIQMQKQPVNFLKSEKPGIPVKMHWTSEKVEPTKIILDGYFDSPSARLLPPESHQCHIRLVLPRNEDIPRSAAGGEGVITRSVAKNTRVCILFAMTADHGNFFRQTYFSSLLKHNVGLMIVCNPFYGKRKPKGQVSSYIRKVSDLFAMGAALIIEGNSLIDWLEAQERFGALGVAGISLGGVHASLVGVLSQKPVAIVPITAPHSVAPVWTEGVMREVCDWAVLESEMPQYSPNQTAKQYMYSLFDQTTDLRTFPCPSNPELIIQVAAAFDAYMPKGNHLLQQHWPGSELRLMRAGHLSSVPLQRDFMNQAIIDAMDRTQDYINLKGPKRPPPDFE